MIHKVWVGNGDLVVLVSNPESSCADPAGTCATVMTTFIVVDEGLLGTTLVPSRVPVQKFTDNIRNERDIEKMKGRK